MLNKISKTNKHKKVKEQLYKSTLVYVQKGCLLQVGCISEIHFRFKGTDLHMDCIAMLPHTATAKRGKDVWVEDWNAFLTRADSEN